MRASIHKIRSVSSKLDIRNSGAVPIRQQITHKVLAGCLLLDPPGFSLDSALPRVSDLPIDQVYGIGLVLLRPGNELFQPARVKFQEDASEKRKPAEKVGQACLSHTFQDGGDPEMNVSRFDSFERLAKRLEGSVQCAGHSDQTDVPSSPMISKVRRLVHVVMSTPSFDAPKLPIWSMNRSTTWATRYSCSRRDRSEKAEARNLRISLCFAGFRSLTIELA